MRGQNMNCKQNIEKEVISIFSEILEIESDSITYKQTFENIELDSILFIRLVVQCETTFNIQFEDEMLLMSVFANIEEFISYIQKRYDLSNATE